MGVENQSREQFLLCHRLTLSCQCFQKIQNPRNMTISVTTPLKYAFKCMFSKLLEMPQGQCTRLKSCKDMLSVFSYALCHLHHGLYDKILGVLLLYWIQTGPEPPIVPSQ